MRLPIEPHSSPVFNESVFCPVIAISNINGAIPKAVALMNLRYFILRIPATKLMASFERNGLIRVITTAQKP